MSANKIFTAVGSRGTGKTPFITGGDFETGLANLYLRKKGMSTLVIDEIDHVRYRFDFPILHPDKYREVLSSPNSVPGKYRTLAPVHFMGELKRRMAVEKLVWNTLIVWEDYHKHINNPFIDSESILVGNSKQQNVDMFFATWDWGFVYPDIARFTNYYVVFKCSSSPEGRKQYLRGCYDKVCKAWEQVMKPNNKQPYIIVDSGL